MTAKKLEYGLLLVIIFLATTAFLGIAQLIVRAVFIDPILPVLLLGVIAFGTYFAAWLANGFARKATGRQAFKNGRKESVKIILRALAYAISVSAVVGTLLAGGRPLNVWVDGLGFVMVWEVFGWQALGIIIICSAITITVAVTIKKKS